MGATRFSGPVYGAKQTLCSFRAQDISSGGGSGLSSVVLAAYTVPSGEDWYATEFDVFRGSTGSTAYTVTVNDDGAAVSAVTFTSSLAGVHTLNTIAPDSGEYEGTRILAGSTITFTITNAASVGTSSGVSVALYGYRRFNSATSTRTE